MKQYTNVQTTQMTLRQYAQCSDFGKVHSVFNHALNIVDANGTLFTLTDHTLESGPQCFNVADLNFDSLHIKEGDRVRLKSDAICIDHKVNIDLRDVRCIEQHKLQLTHHPYLKKTLQAIEQSTPFQTYTLKQRNVFEKAIYNRIETQSNQILNEIQHGSNNVESYLKSLIGLGIGLTPSGDDFLTGLAYISSLEGFNNPSLTKQLKTLSEHVLRDSNLISYTQFVNALNQEVRSEVSKTCAHILNGNADTTWNDEKLRILNIGSSSGYDMLKGILFGIQISLL